MDLDQAMLLVAESLGPEGSPETRTEQVRAVLLDALARHWHLTGQLPVGTAVERLPVEAAPNLQTWLDQLPRGSADPLGEVYQQMLQRVLEQDETGGWRVRQLRRAHRSTGAYYTGEAVVRYILRRALAYVPDARTLLDPACGAGAFLKAAGSLGRFTHLAGLDADPTALRIARAQAPGAELHHLDALLETFSGEFDLCVGNPPYISSGLRGAPRFRKQQVEALRSRFPQSAEYKLNTYPLFVERGMELLRQGGVLGYILPDSFLTGRFFTGLRRLLLTHTLLELTLIREDFWHYGRVGQSVILLVRKGAPPTGHRVSVRICNRVDELDSGSSALLPVSEVAWGALNRFRLLPDESCRAFVRQMESVPGSRPLGSLVQSYSGLIARKGQRSLLRSTNPHLSGPWGRLLRSGKEIDRYRVDWAGEEVCLDPGLIKSGGHLPYYQQPKLLLRQTADRPQAAYDEQGLYCLNNIHLLVPAVPGLNLRAILALLNSQPVARYYRALTMEAGRLYPQVDLDILAAIPVPPIPDLTAERLSVLTVARERATSDEVAPIEQEIDQVVSQLYHAGPSALVSDTQ